MISISREQAVHEMQGGGLIDSLFTVDNAAAVGKFALPFVSSFISSKINPPKPIPGVPQLTEEKVFEILARFDRAKKTRPRTGGACGPTPCGKTEKRLINQRSASMLDQIFKNEPTITGGGLVPL